MYRTLFFFIVFFAVSVCAQVEFPMASKIINVTKDPTSFNSSVEMAVLEVLALILAF